MGWWGQAQPTSSESTINNMVGVVLLQSRDYGRAIDAFRRTLDLDPGFAPAHELLACAYLGAGRRDEALAELGRATESGVTHAASEGQPRLGSAPLGPPLFQAAQAGESR